MLIKMPGARASEAAIQTLKVGVKHIERGADVKVYRRLIGWGCAEDLVGLAAKLGGGAYSGDDAFGSAFTTLFPRREIRVQDRHREACGSVIGIVQSRISRASRSRMISTDKRARILNLALGSRFRITGAMPTLISTDLPSMP